MLSKAPLRYYFIMFMRLKYISKTEFQRRDLAVSESLVDFLHKAVRLYRVNMGHGGCKKVPRSV